MIGEQNGRPAPVTPIQERASALIAEGLGARIEVGIAERSPLGSHTLRIGDGAGSVSDIAAWAERQPWIDGVASRPPHVYVRPDVRAITEWVSAALRMTPCGDEGAGRQVVLHSPTAVDATTESLDRFRVAATARALAALLRRQGCAVRERSADLPPCELVAEVDGTARTLSVGGVDVRHGALRARHGGSVRVAELLGELTTDTPGHAMARLQLALLRTPRTRRVELDEPTLARWAQELERLLAARDEVPVTPGEMSPEAARGLALELDALPVVIARASAALDPAIVLRCARSLTRRLLDAEGVATDRLTLAARNAVRELLELSAITFERAGDLGEPVVL